MGSGYLFTCDKCGHKVATSGPWEFYRDKQGKRKDYGHPVPVSREAGRAGIHGLYGTLYCVECGKTCEVILVEFKTPAREAMDVLFGRCEPKAEYQKDDAVTCLDCGGADLILGPPEEGRVPCPKCKEGTLVGQMDWVS